jgi:hypothetical protein
VSTFPFHNGRLTKIQATNKILVINYLLLTDH